MHVCLEEIEEAWRSVRKGGRAPGVDGISVPEFRRNAYPRLLELNRALRSGLYVPAGYRAVSIPKETRGERTIRIATVADRIVQRVLLGRLHPLVEAVSLPSSFAYRPGIGVKQALLAVRNAHQSGFAHVLEGDVKDCFDTIRLDLVEELLWELGAERWLIEAILQAVEAGGPGAPQLADSVGLPQGAVLSPTLCNLVLTHLDRALDRRHRRLVRYADDFVVLCRSAGSCESALEEVTEALEDVGLRLNERKTGVTDFTRGFNYLGARFIGSFVIPEAPEPYRRKGQAVVKRKRRKLEYVF